MPVLCVLTLLVALGTATDPVPTAAVAAPTPAVMTHHQAHHRAGEGAELDRVRAVRGRRSQVLGPLPRRQLSRYARLADAAASRVDAVWRDGRSPALVLVVPRTTAQAAALLARHPADLAGVAAVNGTVRGHGPASGRTRVVVNPRAFARLSARGRRVVLMHEATHVATSAATTGRTPPWLVEGFADWVAYRSEPVAVGRAAAELQSAVRAGRLPRGLPTRVDLVGAGPGRAAAYEGAWLACRLVARRWGVLALVHLYRSAAAGQRAALRSVLHTTTSALTVGWRLELRRLLR